MIRWLKVSRCPAPSRLGFRGLAALALLFFSGAAAAICSADYAGLATINEISDKDQFIEIKVLTESIDESIYSEWELDFCSSNGNNNNPSIQCSYDLPISGANDAGAPWLVVSTSEPGVADVDLAGMELRLKDQNGATIDFVRVGAGADDPTDNRQVSDPDCGPADLPYDSQLEVVGGQSGQFALRKPDGTGDWSMATGASAGKSTESTTNDDDAVGPFIRIDSVSVFQGEVAEFNVSLSGSQNRDILVNYQTKDGTAVAGTDYSSASGVLTIPAGELSARLEVATLSSGSTVQKRFIVELSNPRDGDGDAYGRLATQIGVGTILPQALVTYRMEQSSWSGSPGEVLDSSGNDRHATALNGANTGQAGSAIPGNPGTCRYGDFDGTNDQLRDADAGLYLNGRDAITVMAWVYNSAPLAGNDRGILFTDDTDSGRDNRLGLRYDTEGFFGNQQRVIKASISSDDCEANAECLQVETVGDTMVRDGWQHLAMTWQSGRGIKIFVDGVEAAVSATEGSGGDGLLAHVQRLDIGQGAKGQRWQGRIDEFRIFGAALGADKIDQQRLRTFPCSIGPDHLRLTHPGSGLTCSPVDITVSACADENCSNLFSDPVTVDFTSPAENWSPDPVTFTGTTSVSLQYTTAVESVTLDAAATSPLATNPPRCFNGDTETCDMRFLESGFIIEVPDHTAATSVGGTIAAVRTGESAAPESPQRCVPAFSNVTRDLGFWSTYSDPATGTEKVAVNTRPVATAMADISETTALEFDADGIAAFDLQYPDAGKVRLNAVYEGSEQNDDAGLMLTGNSEFIARPARFQLDIPGNPAAADADGGVFRTAGEIFEATVSALNANGEVTPNFGQEITPESVRLETALVAPSGGENPALVGGFGGFGQACNGSSAGAGTACGEFNWPEVGIIALTPRLEGSAGYLGSEDVVGTRVDNVGRFIPARFDLAVTESGIVDPFCSVGPTEFAYTGQALNWQPGFEPVLTVSALNTLGAVTRNYTSGDFLKLGAVDLIRAPATSDNAAVDAAGNPFPVTAALSAATLANLGDGEVAYTFSSDDTLIFDKTTDTRVAPFRPDYAIVVSELEDSDGVTASPQTPLDINPSFGFEIRYGRLDVDNAYGPETADLVVPFRADYYTGSGFAPNEPDSCWSYDTAAAVAVDDSGLSGGSTSVIPSSDNLALGQPPTGSELILAAPGEGNTGDVALTFSVPNWLQGDYDADGTLENPSALATFGVYRGHDRVIYWRER